MRQAAEESQSLQDRLAKAIATAAELEQVVETRQQEMQESQRAMELAYDSHKNSLGSQVDQSVRARERREQTPDELRELERRIQELIGGSTTSSAENIADQLKQAAQKCYEALKVKLSAEAQAFQARASLAGPKQEDDDMFELKSQRSFMDATSVNKRSVEEETISPTAEKSRADEQETCPGAKRSRGRSRSPLPGTQPGGKGQSGTGKDKDKASTEGNTTQG